MPERLTDVSQRSNKPRLFGRDAMVEDIVASLLSDSPPPIPIVGGPGIGKTTVSLAALHDSRVATKFGHHRYFVHCESAKTADGLLGEIAQTVGVPLGPNLEARLFAWLEEASAVLMLDNAETPWDADREATERLLTNLSYVQGLALLASVRGGQWPYGPAWRETIEVKPLLLDDAKAVFLAIAGAKHGADPLLDTLVSALDGLPLAITLMAHLPQSEPNLSGVWRDWQRKHAELLCRPGGKSRLTDFALSIELSISGSRMTPEGRRLLSVAALLPDGIAHTDLDVLLPDEAAEAARVLRAVGLAHDEKGRLRLLAPVREYIAAAHPPEDADQEQAMEHYISLARTLGPQVGAEGGAEAITRLAANLANIEVMIRLGLAAANPLKAIESAIHLTNFSIVSGYGTSSLLAEAREFARDQNNFLLLANCIKGLGDVALRRSDHDAARLRYDEALLLYRGIDSVLGEANCIQSLGEIAFGRSDHDTARSRYDEALLLYRRIDSVLGEANCIQSLGDIALGRLDYEMARAQYQQALPLYRQINVVLGEANCILSLGDISLAQSDHGAALAQYEKALPLYRCVGDVLGEANCIRSLGDIASGRSEYDSARAQFEVALKFYEWIPEPYSIGGTHRRLARIATNDTDRRTHVDAARKAWTSINRPDLVQQLDAEFPVPPPAKRRRKPALAAP